MDKGPNNSEKGEMIRAAVFSHAWANTAGSGSGMARALREWRLFLWPIYRVQSRYKYMQTCHVHLSSRIIILRAPVAKTFSKSGDLELPSCVQVYAFRGGEHFDWSHDSSISLGSMPRALSQRPYRKRFDLPSFHPPSCRESYVHSCGVYRL